MQEGNILKLIFGECLEQSGSNGFITSSVCHNYGVVSGCDEFCPALLNGDCEVPIEALKVCNIDDDDRYEILKLYPTLPPQ